MDQIFKVHFTPQNSIKAYYDAGINEIWHGNLEGYAKISAPDSAIKSKSYLLHPTILDVSFQTLLGCVLNLQGILCYIFLNYNLLTLTYLHSNIFANKDYKTCSF